MDNLGQFSFIFNFLVHNFNDKFNRSNKSNEIMEKALMLLCLDLIKSPGLVVMGRDSCYKGHGFKSRHRILDGHFSHCNVCLKRPKINEKRGRGWPIF